MGAAGLNGPVPIRGSWIGLPVASRLPLAFFLIIVPLLCAAPADAAVRWHWQDRFDAREREQLRHWITYTVAGLERLVGPLPFELHVTFHRRRSSREPVPWANTERSRRQGVHFHVDPAYPLQAFLDDWTAPHELSHLVVPYLGRRHAWFAEGFASYMQYQVMHAMGVLDADEVRERYRRRLDKAGRQYTYHDRALAEAAPRLQAEGRYPVMYWGGAIYFLRVDAELRGMYDTSLLQVLRDYLACCRQHGASLHELLRQLDAIADADVFVRHLGAFTSERGFPAFEDLFR